MSWFSGKWHGTKGSIKNMYGVHKQYSLCMHATNEMTTAKMQFFKPDEDLGKYFFSICFKGKKTDVILECLHSWQDIVHIKMGCCST